LINYKYLPESFANIQFMEEDFRRFYLAYEMFKSSSTDLNRAKLQLAWLGLFLTIKQRELGGQIRKEIASDMREYIERLTYD